MTHFATRRTKREGTHCASSDGILLMMHGEDVQVRSDEDVQNKEWRRGSEEGVTNMFRGRSGEDV
eukprot:6060388-Karenia_brevis.AAC.1